MYNLFNNILKARCYAGFLYGMHSCLSAYEEIVWLTTNDCEKISPVDKLIFKQLEQDKMII